MSSYDGLSAYQMIRDALPLPDPGGMPSYGDEDPWPPYDEIEARANAAALREREERGEP